MISTRCLPPHSPFGVADSAEFMENVYIRVSHLDKSGTAYCEII